MDRRLHLLLVISALLASAALAGCSGGDDGADAGSGSSGESDSVALADGGLPDLIDEVRASVVAVVLNDGEGSGVVWSADGHIVTNYHVVAGSDSVEVVLASGERLPAEVVAGDPLTDLAVIRVDRDNLQPATFSKELPRVGTPAVAVGNPLGFENSVTLGIVSGLHRAIPSGGQTPALVDLLQTDAAISPGNSGGALIGGNGEVIGVNVAYIPPSASAVSLGFAIPSPTVIDVVEQLIETGSVEHAFLGIEPRPLTAGIASQLGLSTSEGVLVFGVTPGGAADAAGLQAGDVIVEFDGREVASIEDLYGALRMASPGQTVSITVSRDEDEESFEVTLENRPSPGDS